MYAVHRTSMTIKYYRLYRGKHFWGKNLFLGQYRFYLALNVQAFEDNQCDLLFVPLPLDKRLNCHLMCSH